jgi:hypothetical protein
MKRLSGEEREKRKEEIYSSGFVRRESGPLPRDLPRSLIDRFGREVARQSKTVEEAKSCSSASDCNIIAEPSPPQYMLEPFERQAAIAPNTTEWARLRSVDAPKAFDVRKKPDRPDLPDRPELPDLPDLSDYGNKNNTKRRSTSKKRRSTSKKRRSTSKKRRSTSKKRRSTSKKRRRSTFKRRRSTSKRRT